MSIDRAKALLSSTDVTDHRNGCALVINAAATCTRFLLRRLVGGALTSAAANVPEILSQGIVNLLLPKLRSDNADLVMKACWAVNNLCVHVLPEPVPVFPSTLSRLIEKSRDAVYQAGVLEYMPAVLRHTDPEVLKKAAWALTNLSRSQQAQKDLVRHGTFRALINLLTTGVTEVRGAVLQPLCNLVLDAENQNEFLRQGGIGPVVALLTNPDERTRELAVTLVSFVTTNHDSVRDALIDAGVLRPLRDLVDGAGTAKEQEYALNALTNLSLSDMGENAIAAQGVLPSVVGLLSSSVTKLRQQSAMLLSNLLTSRKVRESIRYIGWVDPVLDLASSDDPALLQQVLRVTINIAFDGHCRSLLVKRSAERKINDAAKRVNDPTVQSLATTALKNLSVPVAADVQQEVEEALRTGEAATRVAPPEARRKAALDDLSELDALVGDISRGKREHSVKSSGAPVTDSTASRPAPASAAPKPATPSKPLRDPLDDLVVDLPTPVQKPAPKPATPSKPAAPSKADALDDLLNDLPPPRKQNSNLDDLDDLLNEASKPKSSLAPKAQPAPQKNEALDDLDSLLQDIPRKSERKPAPVQDDDLDDLLAGLDVRAASKPEPSHMDDIDSLLAGVGGGGSHSNEIDDLLAGIEGDRSGGGMDAIDDLLADLSK